jgi:hypothetical protein
MEISETKKPIFYVATFIDNWDLDCIKSKVFSTKSKAKTFINEWCLHLMKDSEENLKIVKIWIQEKPEYFSRLSNCNMNDPASLNLITLSDEYKDSEELTSFLMKKLNFTYRFSECRLDEIEETWDSLKVRSSEEELEWKELIQEVENQENEENI